MAPASIGNLLQLEQVRWLCEEGVERYDMGPVMDYKRSWMETHRRFDAVACGRQRRFLPGSSPGDSA